MHLTDEQLNEYLDNEIADRAQIELHLSSCDDCGARLTALQLLFVELDSLPEVKLSTDLAARFASPPNLTPQLPRWLTLTASLQVAVALIALLLAAPVVTSLLPQIESPSLTEGFIQIQARWISWLDLLSTLEAPTIPQLPALDMSSLALTLTLAGASVLWLVGNGLLLRKQIH